MLYPLKHSSRYIKRNLNILNFLNQNNISTTKQKQQKNKNDTIFIRHAQSQFNKACQDYRQYHKIDYDWDKLCQHPGFEQSVAYNPDYFDCPLTSKGLQQCYLTGHKLNLKDIDIILVSPHQRTLQTCASIFKHSKSKFNIPVIVQPLVAGSLWSSCDISKNLQQKTKQFPLFDFTNMLNQSQLWFIQNLSYEDKLKINEEIKKNKLKSFKDKQLLILNMLKNKVIYQNNKILRDRAWKIKLLLKNIKEKHYKILVISHYYIIQYINTKKFDENTHKPIQDVDLQNCYPYYNKLDHLINNGK